jgi:hypothetical protein
MRVVMESLKLATIRAAFDTLEDMDQQNIVVDLMLRKWGLCDMTAQIIHLEYPNSSMIFLHRVLGDLTYDEWMQAIARFKQLGIKSAVCYYHCYGGDESSYACVELYTSKQNAFEHTPWCDVDMLQTHHRRYYVTWDYDNFDDFAYYVPWSADWCMVTDVNKNENISLKDMLTRN